MYGMYICVCINTFSGLLILISIMPDADEAFFAHFYYFDETAFFVLFCAFFPCRAVGSISRAPLAVLNGLGRGKLHR